MLAGSKPLRYKAHRFRKMMGGAMRQAGVLAAAALYALDNNVERLAEDHANARLLGERLAAVEGLQVDLSRVTTNMVLIELAPNMAPAETLSAALRERGVLCLATGARRLRLVTHLDVSRADCERALAIIAETAGRSRSRA